MKKSIWWVVGIVIVVIVIAFATDKNGEVNVIKIGVVAPITGGASGYGETLVKGIELAKQDLGNTKNKYEVIYEDDGTTPARAASAAQKLINVDKVSAIITTTSGTGNAVKLVAISAGIPHICICVDTNITKDSKTNFIYLALPEIESRAWVDEAVVRGVKKMAIIYQNHPGFNLIVDTIKPMLVEKGISITSEERYEPSTKDFKTVITKSKLTNPDAYFIGGFPPSLDILGKDMKTMGIKNVAGFGTFALAADLSIFEGDWFTDVKLSDQSIKTRFETAFPNMRFNARTVPEGYDVFTILVSAFESNKPASQYLLDLDGYDGKSGNVMKPVGSNNFSVPVGIWTIKDGSAVEIK